MAVPKTKNVRQALIKASLLFGAGYAALYVFAPLQVNGIDPVEFTAGSL